MRNVSSDDFVAAFVLSLGPVVVSPVKVLLEVSELR